MKTGFDQGDWAFIIFVAFCIGYAGYWIGRWTAPEDKAFELFKKHMNKAYDSGWNDCYKTYGIDGLPNSLEIHRKAAEKLKSKN